MYTLLIVVCPFVLFLLATVLSVLLRYTDSDCPFGIFKLFLREPIIYSTRGMHDIHYTIENVCLILGERFEDTKGVIRSRRSKDRQYKQWQREIWQNDKDQQNITQKKIDWAKRIPLKDGFNSCAPNGKLILLHKLHPMI